MYERNAIVIDRYFTNLFGYDENNNLKNNAKNYFELVEKLEEYQIASENENNVMLDFERVANQIKETQKLQEVLNKRNLKYLDSRRSLFENLDEDADLLNKKFEKIKEDIGKNDEEINTNIEKFIEEIREFNEKSIVRTDCGRERKIVEDDYQKILKQTTDNFSKVNKEKLKEIKNVIRAENKAEEKEKIKEKISKNGSKEKIPFDANVINKAIDVATDIEQKRVEIYLSIFDKTGKLIDEIKNDNIKIDRHKKIVKDSKSKLDYLTVIGEYVVLFLDNERMNTIGGEKEHQRIMAEACENVQKDLTEIQNMYSLLIKEITDKATKKAYKELYNLEYLFELQEAEHKFENNISKLNVAGAVFYPEHWRIEGLQKIYDTFKRIINDVYSKDLTEFEPLDVTSSINEDILNIENDSIESDNEEETILESVEDESSNENSNEEENEETETNNESDDEEFQWDDEDIDDELNFGESSEIIETPEEDEEENEELKEMDDEEEGINIDLEDDVEDDEEDYDNIDDEDDQVFEEEIDSNAEDDEEKRDKEIDKILGFFDENDSSEDMNESIDIDEDFEDLDEMITEDVEGDYTKEEKEPKESDKKEKKGRNRKSFDEKLEEKKNKEEKKEKKKMSLFGRRKKE